MKGIVFTEYLEFVENQFGYEMVDQLLNEVSVPSGGNYTAVGSYDFSEMVQLLMKTSQLSQSPPDKLLYRFGLHVMPVFRKGYPIFFEGQTDAFDFLETLEDKIHPQVLVLYPDAELPRFDIQRINNVLIMDYKSSRSMGDFALGLIHGCLEIFGEKANVSQEKLVEDGSYVRFTITRGTS
ncbi:MAG: heme NO-binding domain-containing protein [Cyclobacteriaceae bacterium]